MAEKIIYPFSGFIEALRQKDDALYHKLRNLPVNKFWMEWKDVYPEDFRLGGQPTPDASSIIPR